MEQKPKLEFQVNTPTKIKLQTESKEGQSRYGNYHLYNIVNGDGTTEYSLFAADELHEQLKKFKKADELQITKLAASRGNKIVVTWEVKKLNENIPAETTVTNITNELTSQDDFYYTIMEKSFDDALRIQNKFNGMANVNQLAVTIFISRLKHNNSFVGA